MQAVTDLVRWDVPFADARDPSVSLVLEHGGDAAVLIVAPSGIDQYPKYLVRFERVLVSLCHEEAVALARDYHSRSGVERSVCAYLCPGSPWVDASRYWTELSGLSQLQHYLIFGGDSIVELVAAGQPTVEQIQEKRVIESRYEV